MLSNSVMAKIIQHADNRKNNIAARYRTVVPGPGGAPALQGAANAGIDLALEKLATGGIPLLNTVIDQHATTDKLWRTNMRSDRKVVLADKKVSIGQLVQHGIQLDEMKLMMKFARRMHGMELRANEAKRVVDSNIVRWMHPVRTTATNG